MKLIKNLIKSVIKPLLRRMEFGGLFVRKSAIGRDNLVECSGVLKNVELDLIGNGNRLVIHPGARVSNTKFYLRGDKHCLEIGEKCVINGGVIWLEDNNCRIKIGKYTTVESAHLAVTEPFRSIIIGDDCMLSTGIEIRTGDSHSIIDRNTGKRINYAEDVVIGDHVWLGANSIVLKGVVIGNGSLIATGAIVTKEIPPDTVAGGVPARVLRRDVAWLRERLDREK